MRHKSIFRCVFFSCVVLPVFLFLFTGTGSCLELKSDAFENGQSVPVRYTGFGENVSPELSWDGVPDGTQSFALIMEDPDAPMGTWIHWVVYNIPKDAGGIREGLPKISILSDGTREGRNSFGQIGYGGPQPPPGPPHGYIFTLYALDGALGVAPGAGKDTVMAAMKGHIRGKAQLVGQFGR
jgi:Raf kinase inhibitor-like YbhB/YbcL family protein